jgi:hypothetical protein
MGTKKEAAKRKADWYRAILEGRVLKLNHGQTMKERAERSLQDDLHDGLISEGPVFLHENGKAILIGEMRNRSFIPKEGPRTIADKLLEARASREDAAERERIYGRKRRV